MRSNVFKKALILAAAAFVTAVIGIGGAKLKVQAATYSSGDVYCNIEGCSDPLLQTNDIVSGGVTIHFQCVHVVTGNWEGFHVQYNNYDGTTLQAMALSGNITFPQHGCSEWIVQSVSTQEYPPSDPTNPGKKYTELILKAVPHTVTYQNEDGTVLQTFTVNSGAVTPPYTGATPTKAPAGGYTYSWDPADAWTTAVAANVTADVTYTAKFTGTLTNYTITWKNDDGTTLKTDTVAAGDLPNYGGTPSKPDDENYTYTFSRWDPNVQLATADATYTAVYLQDPKPATGGGSEPDSSSSSGDGSGSGDGTNGGANGGANGNRAPKTADTMPGIIVIALAGLLGGALLITGGRKASK